MITIGEIGIKTDTVKERDYIVARCKKQKVAYSVQGLTITIWKDILVKDIDKELVSLVQQGSVIARNPIDPCLSNLSKREFHKYFRNLVKKYTGDIDFLFIFSERRKTKGSRSKIVIKNLGVRSSVRAMLIRTLKTAGYERVSNSRGSYFYSRDYWVKFYKE